MLFAQVTALTTIASTFDCQISLGDSKFDLRSLAGVHTFEFSEPTPPTVTKNTYSVSICSPLPPTTIPDFCPDGTLICSVATNQRLGLDDRVISVIPIASENGDMGAAAHYLPGESTTDKGLVLHLGGGLWAEKHQVAMIEMICDGTATSTAPTFVSYEKNGLLNLKWVTIAACSTTSSTPPPPSPPSDREKTPETPGTTPPATDSSWGFFTWFCALFLLTFLAYFIGGTYYNYSQFGIVEPPHKEVWSDMPYVVADLFKGRGGSRNGYNSLG